MAFSESIPLEAKSKNFFSLPPLPPTRQSHSTALPGRLWTCGFERLRLPFPRHVPALVLPTRRPILAPVAFHPAGDEPGRVAGAHLVPNQQRTLNELQYRNFVNKCQLSEYNSAPNVQKCVQYVRIPSELPFCKPSLVVGLC